MHELKEQPAKIPDWAIAYAICHRDYVPQRLPPKSDWGLQDDIDHLKAARGGRLPPGVPDCLTKQGKQRKAREGLVETTLKFEILGLGEPPLLGSSRTSS